LGLSACVLWRNHADLAITTWSLLSLDLFASNVAMHGIAWVGCLLLDCILGHYFLECSLVEDVAVHSLHLVTPIEGIGQTTILHEDIVDIGPRIIIVSRR